MNAGTQTVKQVDSSAGCLPGTSAPIICLLTVPGTKSSSAAQCPAHSPKLFTLLDVQMLNLSWAAAAGTSAQKPARPQQQARAAAVAAAAALTSRALQAQEAPSRSSVDRQQPSRLSQPSASGSHTSASLLMAGSYTSCMCTTLQQRPAQVGGMTAAAATAGGRSTQCC
jgi:hypothetical protein